MPGAEPLYISLLLFTVHAFAFGSCYLVFVICYSFFAIGQLPLVLDFLKTIPWKRDGVVDRTL
jgi:hypothetical protein